MKRPSAPGAVALIFGTSILIIAAAALSSLLGIWDRETLDAVIAAGRTN